MSIKNKKFYITTPIYYVNASPHIGHTYTTVAADVLARYHRMIGDKTFFLTGTDEHGAKIEEKAEEAGKNPQEFADEVAASFKLAWQELNISNDGFIRTTDEAHKKAVQKALQYMYDKGDIYLGKYESLYCRGCEQYKNEKDLIDGKCPDHKTIPEKMSEESYMFKLSKYKNILLEKIEKDAVPAGRQELKISPAEKKNEILSFYKNEGLNDVSFSRKNVKWGIPIPWDESHTTYVWADAFLNYLTGLGWDGSGNKASEMWPADVQLMSKDILRVHATIWPAMLLSLDLSLPKEIFIHGFFMIDGQKMSKSLGNVIAPADLVKRYGVDGARYLLMSATPFGHDGDIGYEKFDEKYNADLANGLGNLVARTLSMTEKYFEGRVPSPDNKIKNIGLSHRLIFSFYKDEEERIWGENAFNKFSQSEYDMEEVVFKNILKIEQGFEEIKITESLKYLLKLVGILDGYISDYKPFQLIKEDEEKTATVLYNCLESIRLISLMVYPFMPETAGKIYESLGLGSIEKVDFQKAIKWGGLTPGTEIKKPDVLFPRIQ